MMMIFTGSCEYQRGTLHKTIDQTTSTAGDSEYTASKVNYLNNGLCIEAYYDIVMQKKLN